MLASPQSATALLPTAIAAPVSTSHTVSFVQSYFNSTEPLNTFLLNQIAYQTTRYEQQFEALLNGEQTYDELVCSQRHAVKWADMLDQQAILHNLKTCQQGQREHQHTNSENAHHALHAARLQRMALAEPLVERIRLAYLFVFSSNFGDAYKAIDDAADVAVTPEALELEYVLVLFQGIQLLRDVIKLASNQYCVALLFEECDTNRDGTITLADLKNAAKRRQCEVPATVLTFLQRYFYTISCIDERSAQHAITAESLNAYMRSNWLYGAFKELLTD